MCAAQSLTSLLETQLMDDIINRDSDILASVDEVVYWWGYDLMSRSPGPAYRDGVFVGTDLDLACFIYALANRGAVINLPKYKGLRARTRREGEMITSAENRHGNVIGLTSNKDVFSFSVRIKDMNVMTSDSVGAFRNFALTDLEGEWYKGWQKIEFLPSADENKFITENQLWTGNMVIFKNFVHPNRWTSFYGQYYFITKAMISRLTEQASHLNREIKRLLEEGIEYPPESTEAPRSHGRTTKEAGKKIKVPAFQVEVDFPELVGEYPTYEATQENLIEITRMRKKMISTTTKLRFATRATELALFKYGQNKMPAWLKDKEWEKGYRQPGKRTDWDRLTFNDDEILGLRKRVWEKTETVAND